MVNVLRWMPGTQIVQQELWQGGAVAQRLVTVVEDSSTLLALYSHPNAPLISRTLVDRLSMPVADRIDLYITMLDPTVGKMEMRISRDSHVLPLTRPDAWLSVLLFWTHDWDLRM